MAICELLYSQTNKLYLCFALYILWKRNGLPLLPAVSQTVCIEPMSSLLCLHVSLGQFLFNYKNYCHFYLPQSSCCVVIMLASRVIPLHHLVSLTFPILCQSVQLAKHFSPKREYNSISLFGELCGVWCQLSQHMDLDLPCQCSHIICSDYNNLHPASPPKKILTCIFALFSRVSKATYFTFQVLTRTHESAFTLRFYLRLFLGPATTTLV